MSRHQMLIRGPWSAARPTDSGEESRASTRPPWARSCPAVRAPVIPHPCPGARLHLTGYHSQSPVVSRDHQRRAPRPECQRLASCPWAGACGHPLAYAQVSPATGQSHLAGGCRRRRASVRCDSCKLSWLTLSAGSVPVVKLFDGIARITVAVAARSGTSASNCRQSGSGKGKIVKTPCGETPPVALALKSTSS
eukprot:scaffold1616_cov395-Prasinococcus_capsulatus_cf.AAC.9